MYTCSRKRLLTDTSACEVPYATDNKRVLAGENPRSASFNLANTNTNSLSALPEEGLRLAKVLLKQSMASSSSHQKTKIE
jgi:hypothetical protein